jgi:CheY-like chemotaxis protein
VEDNVGLRQVVMRQVGDLGYRALEAEDAEAALLLLAREKVDLLFTDVVMPGAMDGYKLAASAMATWPHLKVVMTSGFPGAKLNGRFGVLSGSVRLLTKPYRKDDLARTLSDALNAPTTNRAKKSDPSASCSAIATSGR